MWYNQSIILTMEKIMLSDYPNHLDQIKLSSKQIEDQVQVYDLIFSRIKNRTVEWGMQFPMFIPSFYEYVIEKNSIPSQEVFFNQYLGDHKEWFAQNKLSGDIMEGLKARAFRTYPSVVRDVHFALTVKEKRCFDEVFYNYNLDIEQGIDLIIGYASKLYAVNLFADTYRAYQGRRKKKYRHKNLEGLNYVDLPVQFKGSKECGKFYLYYDRELNDLKKIVGVYQL